MFHTFTDKEGWELLRYQFLHWLSTNEAVFLRRQQKGPHHCLCDVTPLRAEIFISSNDTRYSSSFRLKDTTKTSKLQSENVRRSDIDEVYPKKKYPGFFKLQKLA